MAFRLIPRDARFFELFREDADNLAEAARQLAEMVDRFDRLDERVVAIQALEKRGDQIDHQITGRLENAFVTPYDREDIHQLAARLDDVVDSIQAVAETLVVYDVRQPTDECKRLAAILAEQGVELSTALAGLPGRKGVTDHLQRVHDLEHEADGLSRAAIARLFRERQEPLEVIKWRDLYGALEDGIDAAEDVAEAAERMLHKAT
jgi:predicted phosphate transport protein (TIGR00153 family)